jgi:hypothetical protein
MLKFYYYFWIEEKRSLKHPMFSGSNARGLHADLLEELKDFAQGQTL